MAISILISFAQPPSIVSSNKNKLWLNPSATRSSKPVISLCSTSTSTSTSTGSLSSQSSNEVVDFRGCEGCGREELERGCNGEGRIQGGIATVPGFGWWPIKAYRPCPGLVSTGGRYRRRGQSMDEVISGTPISASVDKNSEAVTTTTTTAATATATTMKQTVREKKKSPRRFKR